MTQVFKKIHDLTWLFWKFRSLKSPKSDKWYKGANDLKYYVFFIFFYYIKAFTSEALALSPALKRRKKNLIQWKYWEFPNIFEHK